MGPLKLLLALFMFACVHISYAEDTLPANYPVAVLVQLRSEHNRMEAMTKDRRYKELEQVTKDAIGVKKAMIYDFTANFHYCPVYYYMDTNAGLIKNKVFAGILLNADGVPVTDPVINSNSADYLVIYYGYPVSQSKSSKIVSDSGKYVYDPDQRPIKGLVLLNDKFQQISYIYKFGYSEMAIKNKQSRRDFYSSSHYEIDYFPLAKLLNKKLEDRKGNRIR